jgi:hypothetical protein
MDRKPAWPAAVFNRLPANWSSNVYSPVATCPGFRNRVCGIANVANSTPISIAVAAIA